jgi:hypothetical protein
MSQNADLAARRKDFKMVNLDENLKNELRKSHFIIGNSNPNYTTTFNSHYKEKEKGFKENNLIIKKNVANKTNSNNIFGSDRVIYTSESHNKYMLPDGNKTMANLK